MQTPTNPTAGNGIKQQQIHEYTLTVPYPQKNAAQSSISVGQMIKMAIKKKQVFPSKENQYLNTQNDPNLFDLKAPYEDQLDNQQNQYQEEPRWINKEQDNQYNDQESNEDFDPNDLSNVQQKLKKYSQKPINTDQNTYYQFSEAYRRKNKFTSNDYNNNKSNNQSNQNVNHGRNSAGKNYSEDFKKNFVRKLLGKVRGYDSNLIKNVMNRQSDRIKVFPNQVAVWVGIYRTVFKVQAQNSKRELTADQAILIAEQSLVQYLNNNIREKKYRFIRVANGTFRALGIRKCTGDYWLKSFIKRFHSKFDPRTDFNLLLSGNKKDYTPVNFQSELFNGINGNNNISNQYNINQPNNNSFNGNKSIDFKRQVIQKIDEEIQYWTQKIFRDKQKQSGTNINILKNWYRTYGRYNLLRQVQSQNTIQQRDRNQQQYRVPAINPITTTTSYQNGRSQVLKKVERLLIQFIKNTPNCSRSKIELQANQVLSNVKATELQNPRIARAWLGNFLSKNCNQIGDEIKIKNSNKNNLKMGNKK